MNYDQNLVTLERLIGPFGLLVYKEIKVFLTALIV